MGGIILLLFLSSLLLPGLWALEFGALDTCRVLTDLFHFVKYRCPGGKLRGPKFEVFDSHYDSGLKQLTLLVKPFVFQVYKC